MQLVKECIGVNGQIYANPMIKGDWDSMISVSLMLPYWKSRDEVKPKSLVAHIFKPR